MNLQRPCFLRFLCFGASKLFFFLCAQIVDVFKCYYEIKKSYILFLCDINRTKHFVT